LLQAAVILLYPVVVNLANEYDKVSLLQFVIILMMGASTAFATPVGYQVSVVAYRSTT
jgi:di/tricarboxylate transporter